MLKLQTFVGVESVFVEHIMEFTSERTDSSFGGAIVEVLDLGAKLCYLETGREMVWFCGTALSMFIVQNVSPCNNCKCIL